MVVLSILFLPTSEKNNKRQRKKKNAVQYYRSQVVYREEEEEEGQIAVITHNITYYICCRLRLTQEHNKYTVICSVQNKLTYRWWWWQGAHIKRTVTQMIALTLSSFTTVQTYCFLFHCAHVVIGIALTLSYFTTIQMYCFLFRCAHVVIVIALTLSSFANTIQTCCFLFHCAHGVIVIAAAVQIGTCSGSSVLFNQQYGSCHHPNIHTFSSYRHFKLYFTLLQQQIGGGDHLFCHHYLFILPT